MYSSPGSISWPTASGVERLCAERSGGEAPDQVVWNQLPARGDNLVRRKRCPANLRRTTEMTE